MDENRVLTQQRRDEMESLLWREGKLNASEQAETYHVSKETIRKDLLYLEEKGIAKKSYGGAVLVQPGQEKTFYEKALENPENKRLIAAAIVSQITEGSSLLLDSGSTAYLVASQLVHQSVKVRVFTNYLKAAQLLSENGMEVYLLGGRVRNSSSAVTGAWAIKQLQTLDVDLAVVGCSGFSLDGMYVESMEEAQIKENIIGSARKVILASDSSKENQKSTIRFARWDNIGEMVTDAGISQQFQQEMKKKYPAVTIQVMK